VVCGDLGARGRLQKGAGRQAREGELLIGVGNEGRRAPCAARGRGATVRRARNYIDRFALTSARRVLLAIGA